MRKDWEIKFLSEACKVFADGDWIESKDQSSDGIRLIQTGNIGFGYFKDKVDKSRFISEDTFKRLRCTEIKAGDLLVSRLPDPVGKSCIIPETNTKMITGVDCTIIRPKDFLLSEFLCYYQMSDKYLKDVQIGVSGATRQRISRKNLGQIKIPIPPLSEQLKIVSILDDAFESIERAKSNAEQNLKNAKELFESYLQGVFENKEDGWKEIILEEATELISKGSSPKWQGINYVDEPGVLFITSENVGENTLLLKEKKYVEDKFNQKEKKSILKNGDVLTNIVGASIGRTAIFDLDENSNINQAVCLIRCKEKILNNEFLTYLLNSPFVKIHLHENEVNNARANLSLGFFRSLVIPLPKLEVQKKIVEKIKSFHIITKDLEVVYQNKIDNIIELKKSILQKAFNGELKTSKISA